MPVTLTHVKDSEDVRSSLETFNQVAPNWPFAMKLARSTRYWVYDSTSDAFGPAKFVGFRQITAAAYDAGLKKSADGDAFNGTATRIAIERSLGGTFQEDKKLSEQLRTWGNHLIGSNVFEGIDDGKWRFITLAKESVVPGQRGGNREPQTWAFLANPDVYRINDAVRELTEDTWVTAGRDIRRGDRVVVWRAQGRARGSGRGVIAFGRVVSDPKAIDDRNSPYWIKRPVTEVQQRVRVRYTIPVGLPLWLADHPGVLGKLSVSRATGGTVFRVTGEQWDELAALAGLSPDDLQPGMLGVPYRPPAEDMTTAPRDPFEVDPNKVDRGNQAHRATQNALANYLEAKGIDPRSPGSSDPDADLLWEHEGRAYVAEVKSITSENEEKQLRLGLGQVLRYRQSLSRPGLEVVAVLVPERMPAESGWKALCDDLGIKLVAPPEFGSLLGSS